ncbi:hypothetical protein [Burkholderia vietnamiensis]|uniref:hypothetical protein n=1 Tax=Burkholderia vietnamiensis TaxID=60552 RepID=UPI0006239AD4|nr:hypothetical protein [Burkholderia vietnamiensis]
MNGAARLTQGCESSMRNCRCRIGKSVAAFEITRRVIVRGRFATPIATTTSSRDVQLREFPRLLDAAASIDCSRDACTAQTPMTLPIHEIVEAAPRIRFVMIRIAARFGVQFETLPNSD